MGEWMSRILAFTSGPADWKALLADPDKHWRTGFSACTLAHCWEAADGFPPEVAAALEDAREPELADLVPMLAVPEFKVPLPGGKRSSQNDIFVLARSGARPVTIMVEGKVHESFGPELGEWLTEASPGKLKRLAFLQATLGLVVEPAATIRYQLLHRAASALLVAEQYHAAAAVLIVLSFSARRAGWPDYEAFLGLFGVTAVLDTIQRIPRAAPIPLFTGWITGDPKFLTS
jgi:hypothetical protein